MIISEICSSPGMDFREKLRVLSLIRILFCIISGLGVFADLESQVGDNSNVFKVPEEFRLFRSPRWGTILMCLRCQKNFDFFEKSMCIL